MTVAEAAKLWPKRYIATSRNEKQQVLAAAQVRYIDKASAIGVRPIAAMAAGETIAVVDNVDATKSQMTSIQVEGVGVGTGPSGTVVVIKCSEEFVNRCRRGRDIHAEDTSGSAREGTS